MSEHAIVQPGNLAAIHAAATAMIYTKDPQSEQAVRKCLAELGVENPVFGKGGISAAIADLGSKPSPKLLVVDIEGVEDPISHIHELAQVCEPHTGVVVIGTDNDIVLYRDLKAAGVADYLFKPLIGPLVTRACHGVLNGEPEKQATNGGKLVITLGVKGGVGATTIATRLAQHLAEVRKRRLILVDLDIEGGDAALQLDTEPQPALREALEHPERVDDLFLDRAAMPISERFHLLSSLEPLSGPLSFNESAVLTLVTTLLNKYRYVFIDVPAWRAALLPNLMHMDGICLLVSDGSLASARDVARWRAFLGPNSVDHLTLHILNQSTREGALSPEEFKKAAEAGPDVVVPYERDVGRASVLGYREVEKCHDFFRALAPALEAVAGEAEPHERSLLSKLLG